MSKRQNLVALLFTMFSIIGGGIAMADGPQSQKQAVLLGINAALNAAAEVDSLTDHSSCSTTLSGMQTGDVVTFEAGGDGLPGTVTTVTFNPINTTTLTDAAYVTTATANGTYRTSIGGLTAFRARISTYANGTNPQIVVNCGTGPFNAPLSGGAGGSYTAPANQGVSNAAGTNLSVVPVPGASAFPISLPSAAIDGTGKILLSPSSAPSPILEAGPITMSANGTSSILTLSGVHILCNLNTTATFIGSITATTSKDGATNFNPTDIVPKDGGPVLTYYQTSGSGQDLQIPVSGKHGVQITVANYVAGTVTLQCDVSPPTWVQSYSTSGGIAVIGSVVGQKMSYATPTTTGAVSAGSNVVIPVSSSSGYVVGESFTITGSDSNSDTTTVAFVSAGAITATTLTLSHVTSSTITPSSTQSFSVVLYGVDNSCTTTTDNAFAGIIVANISTNGTTYTTTPGISNSQGSYNEPFNNMTGTNGNWTALVAGEYGFKLTMSGWTGGGVTTSCDVGIRPVGPVAIGTGAMTACPAGNATTPTEITTGPNGVRFYLGSPNGSISGVDAPSSSTTPSPNGNVAPTSPPNVFTWTYPYVVSQNELLPAGWSVYITASVTPCSYRKW